MYKKCLTILLIEDSPEYAELVRRWLCRRDDTKFVLNWTDSLMAGLNRLAKGGIDAVLLDLGLPDSHGVGTFNTVKLHASGVPIVVLSGNDTESLALQMVQQGAQDYIIKGACTADSLATALQYAIGRAEQKTSAESECAQGKVIGVMGAKGGVGATTFACNLAVELRRQTDQDILLADLDMNSGLVTFLMNTYAKYSILDAAANIHSLDVSFLARIVAHGPGGVDILQSPNLSGCDDPKTKKVQDAVTLIRAFYPWTVLDLGRISSFSLHLLDKVTEIYLVTTISVPALYEAKRAIGTLLKAGLDQGRLRVIVNQVGGSPELSGPELVQLFGIPVCARLPGAAKELEDACTRRELLGANSGYRSQVAGLARKLAQLTTATSDSPLAVRKQVSQEQ